MRIGKLVKFGKEWRRNELYWTQLLSELESVGANACKKAYHQGKLDALNEIIGDLEKQFELIEGGELTYEETGN